MDGCFSAATCFATTGQLEAPPQALMCTRRRLERTRAGAHFLAIVVYCALYRKESFNVAAHGHMLGPWIALRCI